MNKPNFGLMYHCNEQGGMTALMMAARNGHHGCISMLIANGADVNVAMKVNK
jgi:ankyrin repeat protein